MARWPKSALGFTQNLIHVWLIHPWCSKPIPSSEYNNIWAKFLVYITQNHFFPNVFPSWEITHSKNYNFHFSSGGIEAKRCWRGLLGITNICSDVWNITYFLRVVSNYFEYEKCFDQNKNTIKTLQNVKQPTYKCKCIIYYLANICWVPPNVSCCIYIRKYNRQKFLSLWSLHYNWRR